MKCNASERRLRGCPKPSPGGISDVRANYKYPKSGSRGILAPGPRNSSTVLARSQLFTPWTPSKADCPP